MYDLFLPLALLLFVGNFTPGPNNIFASYSGFHFGLRKTDPKTSKIVCTIGYCLKIKIRPKFVAKIKAGHPKVTAIIKGIVFFNPKWNPE